MQFLWIIIAIVCLITGIHKTYYQSFSESYYFYIFTLVSVLMFLLRRYLKNNEKKIEN